MSTSVSVYDLLPEISSWTGIFFYSFMFYVISMVVSMLLAPLLAPTVAEEYKK
jgi:hypothetical protein